MTKKSNIEELLKTPVLKVDICLCCGDPIEPSIDKRGHPFVRCPTCGTIVFFRNDKARIGFSIASSLIAKNRRWYKDMLEKRYRQFMDDKKSLLSLTN